MFLKSLGSPLVRGDPGHDRYSENVNGYEYASGSQDQKPWNVKYSTGLSGEFSRNHIPLLPHSLAVKFFDTCFLMLKTIYIYIYIFYYLLFILRFDLSQTSEEFSVASMDQHHMMSPGIGITGKRVHPVAYSNCNFLFFLQNPNLKLK